jgi:hypothetical protein
VTAQHRSAQPASTWPADWPPCEIWINLRGKRATPLDHLRSAIDTAIVGELRRLDVHPWEMLAARQYQLFGLDGCPPIARAWGTVVHTSHPDLVTSARAAARSAETVASRHAGALDRDCLEVSIGRSCATTIDLPLERLWRLDRQQVIDQLVQAMGAGQDWAAAVLSQTEATP